MEDFVQDELLLPTTTKSENFKFSVIETGRENTAAINLYKKLDYEVIDSFGMFEGDEIFWIIIDLKHAWVTICLLKGGFASKHSGLIC